MLNGGAGISREEGELIGQVGDLLKIRTKGGRGAFSTL
jgi:hypothetical protein